MLSIDIRLFGAEFVKILSVVFFVALLVVIQKVLQLNHKDDSMRCNEGTYQYLIFKFNLLSTQISAKQLVCRDP